MEMSIEIKSAQQIRALLIAIMAAFIALPIAYAVSPPPDGGYPGGNTAEGQTALFSLTTGGFNTATGAGALLANTADQNTATGAGALLSNSTGGFNTANGSFALLSNTTGESNTAIGVDALYSNTIGSNNTATGPAALDLNKAGR